MKKVAFWLFLLTPYAAEAAVYISEIAWMGSAASANHEWIELHNDGGAEDVSGWLVTDGNNVNIKLAGTIPAGSYVVLERNRSDGGSVGNPFVTYTGALVNSGTTLQITRADGSIVDQVAGGTDWAGVGGDNATKDTAQYTNAGWVTAKPTPNAAPATSASQSDTNNNEDKQTQAVDSSSVEDDTEEDASSSQAFSAVVKNPVKKKSNGGPALILTLPDITLELDVIAPDTGYINQPIDFTVEPSGIGDTLLDSLTYRWNFGDGFGSSQKETQHIFSYPGTYLVTIYAGFKRQEHVARHEITILPVKMSLTKNATGDIQVHNDSPYELDISQYKIVGEKTFTFAPYSILLPKQTITIPYKKLSTRQNRMIALYDNESTLLDSLVPANVTQQIISPSENIAHSYIQPSPTNTTNETVVLRDVVSVEESQFGFVSDTGPSTNNQSDHSTSLVDTAQAAIRVENQPIDKSTTNNNQVAYLLLVGVILLALVGVFGAGQWDNK